MGEKKMFKILVVDDVKSNIDALISMLKPKYSILVAKNGRTAINVARESLPDLILLDIIMPDMTGFEVLAELKDSDITRRIPVIFITGRDSVEDEKRGFALGAVDYITKPFHNSIVEARVRTHLQMTDYIRTIEQLVMVDTLTNIPNRRGFNDKLEREWGRAIRDATPISLLMADLDYFKKCNDTYGHQHGDTVLKVVAEIFTQAMMRSTDLAARWGGEEFAMLLPNTDIDGALGVAERIRENVEAAIIPTSDGTDTSITVSIGACCVTPVLGDDVGAFISGADKALYAAKNAGRNRVSQYILPEKKMQCQDF